MASENVFTGAGTPAELLAACDRLEASYQKFKAATRMIRWGALVFFLVFAVLAVLEGAILILVGVLGGIGILIYSFRRSMKGMVGGRHEYLRLLLQMLAQDSGPKSRFQTTVQLNPKPEVVSQGVHPRHASGKQTLLRDSWFTLSGRLGDGTNLTAQCADLIRKRTRRNANGKTKTKERRNCLLRLRLDFDPARYSQASLAAASLQYPFRLPAGTSVKGYQANADSFVVKAVVGVNPAPPALLTASQALLLGLYRVLNSSRGTVK